MDNKKISIIAWTLCGLISVASIIGRVMDLVAPGQSGDLMAAAANVMWMFSIVVFAVFAALIITRQPRNPIGWLMMLPAASMAFVGPIETYLAGLPPATPATPGLPLLLMLWVTTWGWMLLIFPVLLIPLLFPTGQPPSPRWRWVAYLALGMFAFFIFVATFGETLGAPPGMTVHNPIGFIPDAAAEVWIIPWLAALVSLTLLGLTALFVRYRRGTATERQQIKWLLYAFAVFAAFYVSAAMMDDETREGFMGLFFAPTMLAIPVSIAIAILRYRLFDIDLIIRRTLVYSALTVTLALVYFGSVALLQEVFQALTGQGQSPVVTVISTLAIAGLFTPLRRRIQNDIDRRFYRKKYDGEKALAAFAQSARDETDLDALTARLAHLAQETLQPEQLSVWLKDARLEKTRQDSGQTLVNRESAT